MDIYKFANINLKFMYQLDKQILILSQCKCIDLANNFFLWWIEGVTFYSKHLKYLIGSGKDFFEKSYVRA